VAVDASPVPDEPIAPELAALAAAEGLGGHRFTIYTLHAKDGASRKLTNFFLFLALVGQLRP
jgi:hypothetical protein